MRSIRAMTWPRLPDRSNGAMAAQRLIVYTDGAISPTRGGAGMVISDEAGRVLALANRALPAITNNEAEYAALILALESVPGLRYETVEIRMDSEIVIGQMTGRFAVNSPALKVWHRKACALVAKVPRLHYQHIPREQNRFADALAADAVLGHLWKLDHAK